MDEAIAGGMAQMLATRENDYFNGAQRLGWKVGFNVLEGRQALGIEAPIVGYLTNATLVPDGATISIDGFTGTPVLEQEIAVRIGEDGQIAASAAALEITDLGDLRMGVERVLAGNIFHRAVMLGEFGDEPVSDEIVAMVRHVGAELEAAGESLQPGDVIITGAYEAGPVKGGEERTVDFGPRGTLSVRFDA